MANLPTSGVILASLLIPVIGCSTDTPTDKNQAADTGTLTFQANGEDFVRQGFTSKDGWSISFDHVYITLDNVKAYQAEPAFDPQKSDRPEAQVEAALDQPITLDLAAGDASAAPVQVGTLTAPIGRYNPLSWDMVDASTAAYQG